MINDSIGTAPVDRSSWPSPVSAGKAPTLLLTFGLAVVLGLLAVSLYTDYDLTAILLAAIGVGVPVAWLVWKSPEIGLVVLAFFTSGFVPAKAFDVRLPVGGLDARDLTLLGLTSLILVRSLLHGQIAMPGRWMGLTLGAFLAVALTSVLYALFVQMVEPNWALSELRTIAYYATFFLTALVVKNRRQLAILLAGLFVLADLTAGTLILQQFLGKDNPILAAMSGGTWNVWSAYQGDPTLGNTQVLRIIPPGHVLTFIVSIVAFCLAVSDGSVPMFRLFFTGQFIYLNLGLIFTYSRAQWVASVVALSIVVLLLPGRAKSRLVVYSLGSVLVLGVGASILYSVAQDVFGTQVLSAVEARADSILTPDSTLASNSLQWRAFETEQASKSIANHPLLGVGLGAIYRMPTSLQGEDVWGIRDSYRLTRFVHNSYLYITVKMGMVGIISFLSFLFAVLWTAWNRLHRSHDGQVGGLTLAFLSSFVGLMGWALTQPHFLQTESTTVIGLVAGMLATISQLEVIHPGEMPKSRNYILKRHTSRVEA